MKRCICWMLLAVLYGASSALAYRNLAPGLTVQAHEQRIETLAFSPDGRMLASGSWTLIDVPRKYSGVRGQIRLWDGEGNLLRTLEGHSSDVKALAFSSDGKWLASGAWGGTLEIFDVTTGQATKFPRQHQAPVLFVSFSRDGTTLVSADEKGTAIFWDVAGQRSIETRTLHSDGGKIRSYAYSWARNTFATGSGDQLRLWRKGEEPRLLTKGRGLVTALAFSSDGEVLASANWQEVWLWNTGTAKHTRAFTGHRHAITALTFTPDGAYVVTGDNSGRIILNNVRSGDYQEKPVERNHQVTALVASPVGQTLASAFTDGSIVLWR